ncbi:MAG: hypothetical protein Q7J84_10765 [Sulfuricaulis sp.]|nr:hypothetical protein [Sulfuricaulis sp.]
MARGAVLVEGSPDEISADPRVQEIYLGESVAAGGGNMLKMKDVWASYGDI